MSSAFDRIDDSTVRLYLAAVIGPLRGVFGARKSFTLGAGEDVHLASNTTRDRALLVTVTRSDTNNLGTVALVRFSQQVGQTSTNDFTRSFAAGEVQRFVLKPGEDLTIGVAAVTGPPPNQANFVVGLETF